MGRRCLILALTALLLTGCAGSPGQSAATLAPAESDRGVIYTSHKEEVYGPIVKEFEARTGIWAEVVTGGTNELLARIAGEAHPGETLRAMIRTGEVAQAVEAAINQNYLQDKHATAEDYSPRRT